MEGLVYIGKIIELNPIEGADLIVSATVVCGTGGKWKGTVRKADLALNDICVVYLPDSQLDPVIHASMPFMKDSNWRVKMRKFKGTPSEVLICKVETIPLYIEKARIFDFNIGEDITQMMGVTKYCKPVPAHLAGVAFGNFPDFIPKTDEPNYQREGDLVDRLVGQPYVITLKCDGSSTTAYKYKGHFGVCSRNLELVRNPNNGYWKMALQYDLESRLPESIALQWETCGPGIQSNPMGLGVISAFAFSAYNIFERRYLNYIEFLELCRDLKFPIAKPVGIGGAFCEEGIETLGEGKYDNGNPREGVVVRSMDLFHGHPISFKVINLDYKD